ncbi:ABC transporter ATP-binding protein [Methylonatrum kenyense]|uniref:ABC transporter ATP-binding protein n=1 Tax=Methylonatrum kenyense TaxID=455253 RepID=UPI0020BFDD4E|nr:ABC transporter ATP-binding protein [Methylonatrum kenyense]MCK8516014.1 ABC transporter ATP-binding protein [Methylonatrum kenyense]
MVDVQGLRKQYHGGFLALRDVSLRIRRGEIFGLLGPNGAGKTTLIHIICGIVTLSAGTVRVAGYDIHRQYRETRRRIGLVPQELTNEAFETVWTTLTYSRGLFGKAADPVYLERLLKDLSLWDKRHSPMMQLSGGMKRRVLIAKALSHEPEILFLDEPTAGVDVDLRRDMWKLVRGLRRRGVTIILTTHYIEEAEEMADRIGVIRDGELILVQDKHELMRSLGSKVVTLELAQPLAHLPEALARLGVECEQGGRTLRYRYSAEGGEAGVDAVLRAVQQAGLTVHDLHTRESSLEQIFVRLVGEQPEEAQ